MKRKNMKSKEHLKNLDWDSAISAATIEIEKAIKQEETE
jgi:hypothetical protein